MHSGNWRRKSTARTVVWVMGESISVRFRTNAVNGWQTEFAVYRNAMMNITLHSTTTQLL